MSKPQPHAQGSPLERALDAYEQALNALRRVPDGEAWLPVLLSREQVSEILGQMALPQPENLGRLAELDQQMRQHAPPLRLLERWRRAFLPPEAHWWWYLDRLPVQNGALWRLLAGALAALALYLSVEIIHRFWDGAPDSVSVLGSLLTLVLTGSPFTGLGREVVLRLFRRPAWWHRQAKAIAVTAGLALALVALMYGSLPQFARLYNARAVQAYQSGNLTEAQRAFQRAVALNPDFAPGYYHIAYIYEDLGQFEEAASWYQKALARDLDLAPAYNNLGRVYLLQGEHQRALHVLLSGLRRAGDDSSDERITRYHLLSNLGWTCFGLERQPCAQKFLEQAVRLEAEVDMRYRSAVPHYYLAQVYEALGNPAGAIQQWEDCLRYLDDEDPAQLGWAATAQQRLKNLREVQP